MPGPMVAVYEAGVSVSWLPLWVAVAPQGCCETVDWLSWTTSVQPVTVEVPPLVRTTLAQYPAPQSDCSARSAVTPPEVTALAAASAAAAGASDAPPQAERLRASTSAPMAVERVFTVCLLGGTRAHRLRIAAAAGTTGRPRVEGDAAGCERSHAEAPLVP